MNPLLVIGKKNGKNDFIDILKKFNIKYQKINTEDKIRDFIKNREKIDDYFCKNKFQGLIIIAYNYPKLPHKEEIVVIRSILNIFLQMEKPIFSEFFPISGIFTNEVQQNPFWRWIIVNGEKKQKKAKDGHHFSTNLSHLTLLEPHQCFSLQPEKNIKKQIRPHVFYGKVAGVYNAIYGLPKKKEVALGKWKNCLFSHTRISHFITAEYRLRSRWRNLILNIILFLRENTEHGESKKIKKKIEEIRKIEHSLENRTQSFKKTQKKDNEKRFLACIEKGLNWFEGAGMLDGYLGSNGVYEGYTSAFGPYGMKFLKKDDFLGQISKRADCTADTAFAFSLFSHISPNKTKKITEEKIKTWKFIGENLFKDLTGNWQYYNGNRGIFRGFLGWFEDYYNKYVSYSDDNGRCTLQMLFYGLLKKDINLIKRGLAGSIALKQTMGKNGHRFTRIDLKDFYKKTWLFRKKGRKWFRNHKTRKSEYKSPHYEGWTYAAILYGAYLTEDKEAIKLVKRGIDDYMRCFPEIPVEHSINDDFSKLLIACTILYMCDSSDRHKSYIKRIVSFFAEIQDQNTGAFPERDPFQEHARTEGSNKDYGGGEAALYTSEEDTITDQLYSGAFIAWGLYFANKILEDGRSKNMLVHLLQYLRSIQLRAKNKQLDGAWTRGYDYRFNEPYGANGDVGWGAYSIETGWCVAPIISAFEMFIIDFEPFKPIPDTLQKMIKIEYHKEQRIQKELEKDWEKHSPKPRTHPSKLSSKELKRVSKHPTEWN